MPPAARRTRRTRRTDAPSSSDGPAEGPAGAAADGRPATRVDVVDRGSFTFGTCRGCGWTGPGRRARATATQDAVRHVEAGCAGETVAAAAHSLPSR